MDDLREAWEDAHVCIERGKFHKGYLQLEQVEQTLVQRLPVEVGRASALTASLLRQLRRQKKRLEELFTGNFWVLLGYTWRPPGSVEEVHRVVKRAYRKLALKCHPDKNQGRGAALFQVLTEAYVFLTGENRLQWYSPKLSLSTWREAWDAEFPRQSVVQFELGTEEKAPLAKSEKAKSEKAKEGKGTRSPALHDIDIASLWSMHIAEIKRYIAQHRDDGSNSKAVQRAITRWDLIELVVRLSSETSLKQYLTQTCPEKELCSDVSLLRQEVLSKLQQKQPKVDKASSRGSVTGKEDGEESEVAPSAKVDKDQKCQGQDAQEELKAPLPRQQAYPVRSKDHFRRWERKLAGQRREDRAQKDTKAENVQPEHLPIPKERQGELPSPERARNSRRTPKEGIPAESSIDESEFYLKNARRRGLDSFDEDAFADSTFQQSLRWAGARSGDGFVVDSGSPANSEDGDNLILDERARGNALGGDHSDGTDSDSVKPLSLEDHAKDDSVHRFEGEDVQREFSRSGDVSVLGWGRGNFNNDFEDADKADGPILEEGDLLDEWEKLVGLHHGQSTAKNPFGNSAIREHDFVSRLRASMPARTRSEVAGEAAAEVQREVDFWLGSPGSPG